MSVSNTLFRPFKRNHCKPSKPLGTWTSQNTGHDEEEEDDDE